MKTSFDEIAELSSGLAGIKSLSEVVDRNIGVDVRQDRTLLFWCLSKKNRKNYLVSYTRKWKDKHSSVRYTGIFFLFVLKKTVPDPDPLTKILDPTKNRIRIRVWSRIRTKNTNPNKRRRNPTSPSEPEHGRWS
jgi:hypothetical protein